MSSLMVGEPESVQSCTKVKSKCSARAYYEIHTYTTTISYFPQCMGEDCIISGIFWAESTNTFKQQSYHISSHLKHGASPDILRLRPSISILSLTVIKLKKILPIYSVSACILYTNEAYN